VHELLGKGYSVRTTVRDLSREEEVRKAVGAPTGDGRLTFFAADLRGDDGWGEAVAGCEHVLHVASPFPPTQPKDPDELIVPAREGTLRVLRAALNADVKRIVLTSSVAAVGGSVARASTPLTEEDWTDLDNEKLSPYVRSKTVAERAAWDFVTEAGATERLAAINPGAILGPLQGKDASYSLEAIERLLKGMPGVPRIGFSFVDVRDVADMHVRAMTSAEAGGQRFIAVAEFLWMREVAEILRRRLGPAAAKVPSRGVPDLVVRAMGIFDPGVRSVVNQLGRQVEFSSARAKATLGWSPRAVEETVAETAESMVRLGVVPAP
jgi:nucleoside-diphosphate-sugar epimerase